MDDKKTIVPTLEDKAKFSRAAYFRTLNNTFFG